MPETVVTAAATCTVDDDAFVNCDDTVVIVAYSRITSGNGSTVDVILLRNHSCGYKCVVSCDSVSVLILI